ncbi:MAG: Hsp70 family protein, partial [Blastocatellia bacterium]
RERVEAHNKLDSLIYSTEKTISENKDKIDASTMSEVEAALSDARAKLDSQDTADLNSAYDQLIKPSHKLAELMYKQAGAQGGGPSGGAAGAGASGAAAGSGGGGSDDVIDAEYVDVDDKK